MGGGVATLKHQEHFAHLTSGKTENLSCFSGRKSESSNRRSVSRDEEDLSRQFMNFLLNEKNWRNFIDLDPIDELFYCKISDAIIIEDYDFPPGTKPLIKRLIESRSIDSPTTLAEEPYIQSLIKSLKIASLYPCFSKHYKEKSIKDANNPTELPIDENSGTMKTFTEDDFLNFIVHNQWVDQVSDFLQHCPQCISIASVSQQGKHQFSYINKAFSTIFGADLDSDFSLSHSSCMEEEQGRKVLSAFREGLPLDVALTFNKIDGSSTFNLMSIKPVYNRNYQLRHIICVQVSSTSSDSTLRDLYEAKKLTSILSLVLL